MSLQLGTPRPRQGVKARQDHRRYLQGSRRTTPHLFRSQECHRAYERRVQARLSLRVGSVTIVLSRND